MRYVLAPNENNWLMNPAHTDYKSSCEKNANLEDHYIRGH